MKKTLCCLPLLLAFLVGCGSVSTSGVDNSEAEAINETSVETTAETKEKEASSLSINEVGSIGDWEITITSFDIVDSVSATYGSFNPDEGTKYAMASVHVENKGKNADTFLPSYGLNSDIHSKILYADGYEFSATQLLGYDKDLHNKTLNPLSSYDGEIAFQLPDSVASDTNELIVCFTQNNDELNFKVR